MHKKNAAPAILFVVSGMGLGNSTRCLAIIQELTKHGYVVDVATFGAAVSFFNNSGEVREVFQLLGIRYRMLRGGISGLGLLLSIFPLIGNGVVNAWRIISILRKTQPAGVVTDSNYNLALRIFATKPMLSVNNANLIFAAVRRRRRLPLAVAPQFLVEILDFIFQLIFSRSVISPWFGPCSAGCQARGKFLRVNPVVRRGFLPSATVAYRVQKIAVVYSGSGLSGDMHSPLSNRQFDIVVLGRRGEDQPGIKFHTGVTDVAKFLNECDLIITNAGYSSLAESLVTRKPIIVVPIPGHAEQFINAEYIQGLGVGCMCKADEVLQSVERVNASYLDFTSAYGRLQLKCNGAEQSAAIIKQALIGGPIEALAHLRREWT